MEALSPKEVQAALDAKATGIQIQFFETSTATSQEAADSIGTALGSIVKSLVFMVEDKPVVVLAAGDQKVDSRKLSTRFNVGRKKVKIATVEQCLEYVGYLPGGVPPLGHRQSVPVLIDQSLKRFEKVYAAAGAPNAIFPVALTQLIDISQAELADVIMDDKADD